MHKIQHIPYGAVRKLDKLAQGICIEGTLKRLGARGSAVAKYSAMMNIRHEILCIAYPCPAMTRIPGATVTTAGDFCDKRNDV